MSMPCAQERSGRPVHKLWGSSQGSLLLQTADCRIYFYSGLCSFLIACVNAGMLDLKHAQEWVVTTKLGSSDKRPGTQMPTVPVRTCRFYAAEMVFSFFVLASASYGIFSVNKWSFSIFLTLQGGHFVSTTFLAFTSCIKPADLSFPGQSDPVMPSSHAVSSCQSYTLHPFLRLYVAYHWPAASHCFAHL